MLFITHVNIFCLCFWTLKSEWSSWELCQCHTDILYHHQYVAQKIGIVSCLHNYNITYSSAWSAHSISRSWIIYCFSDVSERYEIEGNTELEIFLLWSYFDFFLLIKGPGIRKNKGTKLIKDELRFLEIFFFSFLKLLCCFYI